MLLEVPINCWVETGDAATAVLQKLGLDNEERQTEIRIGIINTKKVVAFYPSPWAERIIVETVTVTLSVELSMN